MDLEEEFVLACKQGDAETFNRILRSGISVNCRNGEPLRESITNNHVELWTSLLEHPDIDPNLTDENGRTALHVANWFNKEAAAAKMLSMPNINLNQKDNYGNTPIMMGVRFGTSDVLMVMLNCRGVDIMQTDGQGRGLEHFARDSWRMSETEKAEIIDIIMLERRTRIRETTKVETAPRLDLSSHNEVVVLREKVNRILDDLHITLEKEDQDLKGSWKAEMERLELRHDKERRDLQGRQEKSICDLESKHRREKNEMMTKQTKQAFEMKMKQGREVEEMMERQREEKKRKEREKNNRISKYVERFQTPDGRAVVVTPEVTKESDMLRRRLCKETECPVCLLEMTGRVWQCVSGHIICEACHSRTEVSSCPTCRSAFIGRAIALEKMIQTIRQPE